MTSLEKAMVALCGEISELQRCGGNPDVEFFWDNGMTSAFKITQVPTLRITSGWLSVTADHQGVRTSR